MGDFVSVLKLHSKEICFQCKPNLPSGESRSIWTDSLLSYMKPYKYTFLHLSWRIFCFFIYIFFIIYFSPQVKHVETQNDDIQTLCLEKIVFSNVLTSLHATQGDILEENSTNRSYSLQHINNLFGLLLNNLSKETVVSFHHVWHGWLDKSFLKRMEFI